jgi:hypothetical protein
VHFFVRISSGDDIKVEVAKSVETLLGHNDASQQNIGFHLIEKYNLYTHLKIEELAMAQAELQNVGNVVRLIGRRSNYEADKAKLAR